MLKKAFASLPFVLIFAAWLQPLHFMPWTSFHSEVLAFLAIAVAAVVLLLDKDFWTRGDIEIPTLAGFCILLPLFAALQWWAGLIPYGGDAVVIGLYGIFGAIAVTLGRYLLAPRWGDVSGHGTPLVQLFAIVTFGAALLSVLIAFFQALELWLPLEWIVRSGGLRRPGASFGQPNHFATFIVFGIAALTYLCRAQANSHWLVGCGYFILLMGLALTESRTGALSLAFFAIWFIYGQPQETRRPKIRWVLLAGASYLIVLMSWPQIHSLLMSPGGAAGLQGINTSAGSRLTVWPQLWHAALLKPWFGWGLRNVSVAHNEVLDLYGYAEPFTYAHNILLDMAVGMGFPLTLVAVLLCAHAMKKAFDRSQTHESWFVLALALALFVHSMLEFPYAYAYFLFPALFLAGSIKYAPSRVSRMKISCRMSAVVVLATLLLGSLVLREYMAIEEDFRIARFKALNIGQVPENYVRPYIHILTQLDAMVVATNTRPTSGMSPDELNALRNAAQRFPWVAIQNRYAISLALNARQEEAIRQLKVMRAMHGESVFRALRQDWEKKTAAGEEKLKGVADF